MPSMYSTNTNTLTTQDWLVASKDMKLSAYHPAERNALPDTDQQSPVFGTHVREAVAIVKDWIGEKK